MIDILDTLGWSATQGMGEMIASLPKTMKAAVVDSAGPPESIRIVDVPVPTVRSGEVLIALSFASVGSWDTEQRSGAWGAVSRRTILGSDGTGTIAAVGEGVQGFGVGDRVYAYVFGGSFHAEFVSVPARRAEHVGPVPAQLPDPVAGAIPCVAMTALQGLATLGDVREKAILVYGASGGVGSLAVWLGHRAKATIVGTARPDAHGYVHRLGAANVVDPTSPEDIQRATWRGLDGALATANGPTLAACLRHLKSGAPLVYPNGVEPEPVSDRHPSIAYDADTAPGAFERLNAAIGHDVIPLEVTTFALDDAPAAHRRVEAGHVVGKVVLRIR
jgi:NADPH:quinone reductase